MSLLLLSYDRELVERSAGAEKSELKDKAALRHCLEKLLPPWNFPLGI